MELNFNFPYKNDKYNFKFETYDIYLITLLFLIQNSINYLTIMKY